MPKPRLAVLSPFVDKRHGTELHLVEVLPRLADHYEIHLYSQRVEDLDLSKITWHRVARLPGPHLFNYLWWFTANHLYRWCDRRLRGLRYDLVFSPGINCLDADVVSVHVIFANLRPQTDTDLTTWRGISARSWLTVLHRRVYYRLIATLERRIYTNREKSITAVSRKTAEDLKRIYSRHDVSLITYAGIDGRTFNPLRRNDLRHGMRERLNLADGTFVLLLIGNGWHNKGLPTLLEAIQLLKELPFCLLVVGQDDPRPFQDRIQARGLAGRIQFLAPRPDVLSYYAAADCYVGPSLEDAFAHPPAEAMACGLPVIASCKAGVSEIISHGVDGLILKDPGDDREVAGLIELLYRSPDLRQRLGEAAAKTARQYTWDRNAEQLDGLLQGTLSHASRSGQLNRR